MTILIFLAIILVTIVLAIFINRLIQCPLLVGVIFFSITLLVAVILSNIALVVFAIILGIIAFISAFLDCIFKNSHYFKNNKCLKCYNPYKFDEEEDNNCNNNDNTLRIINSSGRVIARINGNSINCYTNNNNCECATRVNNNNFLSESIDGEVFNLTNTSGYCSRKGRR